MPRHKLSLRVLLPLVLLFAQLGAVAHAYTHSKNAFDPAGTAAEQAQFCAQCQSGVPLLAAAGCPDQSFDLRAADCGAAVHANTAALIEAGPRHSFQPRAPPHLP